MGSLNGKRLLITGGSAGLGAVIAQRSSEAGARVAINYSSNQERAEATLKTLHGDGHFLIQESAYTREGIESIVRQAVEKLGGLDIIVANSAWTKFTKYTDLHSMTDEEWMNTYQRNVLSSLWLAQAAEAELRKNHGNMVITASVAGLIPAGSSMAYSVSKAAVIHLGKALAKSLAPEARVNTVAAGLMLTQWAEQFTEEQIDFQRQKSVLKKIITLDDVAEVFCLSSLLHCAFCLLKSASSDVDEE